jgi:hypothetical protein
MPENVETHAEVRYERKDANLWVVLCFSVALIVGAALAHLVVHGTMDHLEHAQATAEVREPQMPLSARENRPRFPAQLKVIEAKIKGPVLKVDDIHDMKQQREAENAVLHKYGWSDPAQGSVRIPIAAALRILDDPAAAKAHGIDARALKEAK